MDVEVTRRRSKRPKIGRVGIGDDECAGREGWEGKGMHMHSGDHRRAGRVIAEERRGRGVCRMRSGELARGSKGGAEGRCMRRGRGPGTCLCVFVQRRATEAEEGVGGFVKGRSWQSGERP